MNQFCGYLAANIRVAFNLQQKKEADLVAEVREAAWSALAARAAASGCKLQRCYLNPECDGSCGCGSSLFDREGLSVGEPESDALDAVEDFDEIARLVGVLEANGGLR
jgi:hypothetical protein